jgi:hypothetical protein
MALKVAVKIVWFSSADSAAAEKILADLLNDGWKITHVAGGGSEHYSKGLATRLRAVGFAIVQKNPSGGGNL